MTAAVFAIALVAAWIHFHAAAVGWLLYGGVTIYVAAFAATLASACTATLLSRDRRPIAAATVLIANYAGSHWAWTTADATLAQAAVDIATACYFVLAGRKRWEMIIGALSLASVFVGGFAALGLIPGAEARQPVFIDWSHPDLVALLGHAANVTLGMGAGDAGRRIRTWMDGMGRPARYRYRARMVSGAPVAARRAREDRRLGEVE